MTKTMYHIVAVCFVLLSLTVAGQKDFIPFELKGTIKTGNGLAILVPIGGSDFNANNIMPDSVKVSHDSFIFSGRIPKTPYAFRILLKEGASIRYISDIFFAQPGKNYVVCNVDSAWETPAISNPSMEEYKQKFLIKYRLENSKGAPDSLLLRYVLENRDSYVGLWNLIDRFANGYKPVQSSIFEFFSKKVKESFPGMILFRKIRAAMATGVGSIFPRLLLYDVANKGHSVIKLIKKEGYTFIDFWDTGCIPCISQFSDLKGCYDKYRKKGFEIITISTDKKDAAKKIYSIISRYSLPWTKYWDINSKEAFKLSIESLPANFLLDKDGAIIRKNIVPAELDAFLEKNL